MAKNSQIENEAIDLIELIQIVWKGKWKIAVIVFISFIAMISYQSTQTKYFTAITEIRPLSTQEINKFFFLNNIIGLSQDNLNFKKITRSSLLNLYIEVLNEKSVFEDAILKFNLIDASQYNNPQEYNEMIIKLASSVKILSPLIDKKQEGNNETYYHLIKFTHYDQKKWKKILMYVNELATETVKKKILEEYKNSFSFLRQHKEYQLENIEILKANTQSDFDKEMKKFEMNQEFKLEDIKFKIDNALTDYDRITADRLAYLREQAAIARKLEVAKNTFESQMFSNRDSSTTVANVQINNPFYLHGYEAIEKEIELIQARDDKKAFINGLLKFEQEKRSLEQDRTLARVEKNMAFLDLLIELEKKQRTIEQDKTLEQIESAFQSTPLVNNNKFSAVMIKVIATKFEYKNNQYLALSIVISLIVGIIYVIIFNTPQSYRFSTKKTN